MVTSGMDLRNVGGLSTGIWHRQAEAGRSGADATGCATPLRRRADGRRLGGGQARPPPQWRALPPALAATVPTPTFSRIKKPSLPSTASGNGLYFSAGNMGIRVYGHNAGQGRVRVGVG